MYMRKKLNEYEAGDLEIIYQYKGQHTYKINTNYVLVVSIRVSMLSHKSL